MTTIHFTILLVIGKYKWCVLVRAVAQIKDMDGFDHNMLLLMILYFDISALTKHSLMVKHHINVLM